MTRARAVCLVVVLAFSVSFGFQKSNSYSRSIRNQVRTQVPEVTAQEPEDWMVLYDSLNLKKSGLSRIAFQYAWFGFRQMNLRKPVIAIADFTQSSCRKRLYVIDLIKRKLILNTYVAHGKNSGQEYARSFSNINSSFQSSLGFYRTLGTYQGKHGLSLRLEGVEKGINDLAEQRAIVMHGADYVSEDFIRNTGRLGRSLGCPAVSVKESKKIIEMLYDGAGLFIYSPDKRYFKQSSFLSHSSISSENQG
jgi:hypothetical protein